jgi:hypothetical protein
VGAIGRDGRLVDAAHMRLAENTLYKAALAGDERGGAGAAPLSPVGQADNGAEAQP